MGCGGSKFGPEGEAFPIRLRPLLHLRFEEIRRRRNGSTLKDSTLSKKELLHDSAGEDDENSVPRNNSDLHADVNGRKSVSLPNETVSLNNEVESEKVMEKGEDERDVKVDAVETETEEEEVEEEGEDEEEGRLICPGSPSFRVYYIDSLPDDDHKDDDCKNDSSNNLHGDVASTNSNEIMNGMKKEKKGRRFRRVMRRGGPGAVKHLLNVKSCYNPASHSHHHHDTQPITPKLAA